jgi:hypothetical protein
MKPQTKIVEQAARGEAQIIGDIATERVALADAERAEQELHAQRAEMLLSRTVDEVHGLSDAVSRARLRGEIAAARLDALHKELARFYEAAEAAQTAADLEILREIDAAERRATDDYEVHAELVAEDLARLSEMTRRRRAINARLFSKGLAGSSTYSAPLCEASRLPGVAMDGPDFWPIPLRTVYGPKK